ncbi:beta-xylosidase [Breznakibacter xylanolyticus]|uniref:Beta-xylosidase n=1 Tax=Breznakibacter xylanolyticus TaxID=990 RepID=A0A2W7NVB2_9BACT|nr:family 43 glycosylhydrolase [Breznakibacter xylanolyticus]PZX17236.1 beta-xylosidase [Breznakibacter xylanolyticus]
MKRKLLKLLMVALLTVSAMDVYAWIGSPTPRLHVEGRFLKDPHGNVVNLHGFAQTYSPYFNENGTKWTNYNVAGCLNYNKKVIDDIMAAGWKMNFMRLHMDPYWSNEPGCKLDYHEAHNCFSEARFRTYLDQVFIPMAEYAASKGLYVVMRPPGVSPEEIEVGDSYNQYLMLVWDIVSSHPKLKNHPAIMYELANEPIRIKGPNGDYGNNSQGHFDKLKEYLQPIVNKIRANGTQNVLWIPGLGWQAKYKGFAVNPIEGKDIGYAIHVYPGWFGSADGGNTSTINGYDGFKKAWDEEIKPVSDIAPIMVTEMDWADEMYQSSWGKGYTGVAGGVGFGANFKKIMDETGNVSWLFFTDAHLLAKFKNEPPAAGEAYTFLNDPEACPWPCYHWFEEYSKINYPRPDFTYRSSSDNGDGTFTNPVVFGDFPDPDVIRVGDVYYMSTTTMHHFPGATILKSYDLVNWQYCSNPLEKIESSDCYNLDGCNRYSHGQWASSLKYHKGTYYLHFNTLDEGSYLLTATDPEGTWTKRKLEKSFYDAGLFFDDDDKLYVVYGIANLRIAQLDADFKVVKDEALSLGNVEAGIVNTGTEGCHMYKINGYYYIYATTGGQYATQVAFRSTSVFGTYDEKEVFNFERIHQGPLIQTQTGEWWTILFADKGAYGRLPTLQPVTWVDNWPMVGVNGKGVTTYAKPNVGNVYPATALPTNDNFRHYKLSPQWEWNHNPDDAKWSLVKRAGFLRLYTANVTDNLRTAKNTITQRILGFPKNEYLSYGTVKLHLDNMVNGDITGLAVFQDPYAYVGVKMDNGQKSIVWFNSSANTLQTGAAIADDVVYLRAVANYNTSKADFYYSTDDVTYTLVGTLDMKYSLSVFVGNRFCIFNYATSALGGYVDVDWFSTEKAFSENAFYDDSFKGYSEETLTLSELSTDNTTLNLLTGSAKSFKVTAKFLDGHTEDVTLKATYLISNPAVVAIKNGQLITKSNGDATVTVTYQGGMGEAKSIVMTVAASYFPLATGLFNPSIHETGTFDAATKTVVTGKYGFAGWQYSAGLDLSNYKYLVAKLASSTSGGASFRAYDESSYWTKPVLADFGSGTRAVINLANSVKNETTIAFDPSHIYIIGFWSMGGTPIVLSDVYVTNNDDFSKPLPTDPMITLVSNQVVGGTVKGGGVYAIGASCKVTATPAEGYSFAYWMENGTIVSSDAAYTFTVSGARDLTAYFTMSNNNFKVQAVDCSCRGANDGVIELTFTRSGSYTIAVTADGYSKSGTATGTYRLSPLAPGTYRVSVSSESSADPVVFTVVVGQPDELTVMKVAVENGKAQYQLSGADQYYVSVNDEWVIAKSASVDVALKAGENRVTIRTDVACQGQYDETIYLDKNGALLLTSSLADQTLRLSPNPVDCEATLVVPGDDERVMVEIVSLRGVTHDQRIYHLDSHRDVLLDVSALPAGIYTVKVVGATVNAAIKMVKQ